MDAVTVSRLSAGIPFRICWHSRVKSEWISEILAFPLPVILAQQTRPSFGS